MTCIVGYIEGGTIYMGADSAGVSGTDVIRERKDSKVFIKDNMIFGFTSSFRMGQLLRHSLEIPPHPPEKDDYTYMCTDFVDAVIKVFGDKKWVFVENESVSGGYFMVGYKENLYFVCSDFQVGTHFDNYNSCGCGQGFALGALHTLEKYKLKPEKRILKALEAATKFSTGVCPPFVILKLERMDS